MGKGRVGDGLLRALHGLHAGLVDLGQQLVVVIQQRVVAQVLRHLDHLLLEGFVLGVVRSVDHLPGILLDDVANLVAGGLHLGFHGGNGVGVAGDHGQHVVVLQVLLGVAGAVHVLGPELVQVGHVVGQGGGPVGVLVGLAKAGVDFGVGQRVEAQLLEAVGEANPAFAAALENPFANAAGLLAALLFFLLVLLIGLLKAILYDRIVYRRMAIEVKRRRICLILLSLLTVPWLFLIPTALAADKLGSLLIWLGSLSGITPEMMQTVADGLS